MQVFYIQFSIEQLHIEQSGSNFVVYRGQGLSKIAFDELQQTKGGLMSFNNFLSTSKKLEVSLCFARNATEKPENIGILFIMNIQSDQSTTSFASITHLSYYGSNEDEVLFTMHSIFRIDDIIPMDDESNIFIVNLTLTNGNNKDLQMLMNQIREESFPDCEGWYRLGLIMAKIGEFKKAQEIYEILLEKETNENEKAPIYHQLGRMKYNQEEYEEALIFYKKSLDIEEKLIPSRSMNLANSYNNLGLVYDELDKYAEALSFHQKALAIRQQSLPSNHSDLAVSYNNIGNVYDNMDEHAEALSCYKKSLKIKQQSLSCNHPDLATSYYNMALLYEKMNDRLNAFFCYEKAMKIGEQSLPANHPDLQDYQREFYSSLQFFKHVQ